jgi:magnesium transporter
MYYVGFSTATLVASLIMFQGFNTDDPAKAISLLAGFVITFLGVHLLEISRKPASYQAANGHSALEGGLMNPRLSLSGRMSIDGWEGAAGTPIGGVPPRSAVTGHLRRSSGHRQGATLFDALDDDDRVDSVGLEQLAEEDEDYEEVDERTRLRADGNRHHMRDGSRSGSGSPADARRSPR